MTRRLRLGKRAGELEIQGTVVMKDGSTQLALLIEAARLGGHGECVRNLKGAMG